jgi:hypothetical protein
MGGGRVREVALPLAGGRALPPILLDWHILHSKFKSLKVSIDL